MKDLILTAEKENNTQPKSITVIEGSSLICKIWEDQCISIDAGQDLHTDDVKQLLTIANNFDTFYYNIKI